MLEDKTYLNPHSSKRCLEKSITDLIVTRKPSAVDFVKNSTSGIV